MVVGHALIQFMQRLQVCATDWFYMVKGTMLLL